jgi:hypothetical protein
MGRTAGSQITASLAQKSIFERAWQNAPKSGTDSVQSYQVFLVFAVNLGGLTSHDPIEDTETWWHSGVAKILKRSHQPRSD